MFYRISMQICEYDVLVINFFSTTCHDTVSYYDTILTSLLINYYATSDFYLYDMHNTAYDTLIVTSLRDLASISVTHLRFTILIANKNLSLPKKRN
jgi:hypothetical protein